MKISKNQKGFNDTITIAIIAGILGSVFILGVYVWKEAEINNMNNDFIITLERLFNAELKDNIELPIDSSEEAIAVAKKASTGLSFFYLISEKYGTMKSSAKFYEDKNYWYVSFYPENTYDLWYELHISSEGTIIYEGGGEGG